MRKLALMALLWSSVFFVLAHSEVNAQQSPAEPEVTLRLHHFLSPLSVFQKRVAEPWKKAVEKDSDQRISVRIFPALQLGGSPSQLYDQARDGIADIVWTLPGYTAGRFPTIEVFELPFMVTSATVTSAALQAFFEEYLREEFADVHPLFFFTHSRGSIHTRRALITTLNDFKGLRIRAPGEVASDIIRALGGTPVGMPVNQVVPSLSRGVIDGAMLPFQVILPLGIEKLTPYTTLISGSHGLYTATFIVAMNKKRYLSLSPSLQAVIDRNSGMSWAIRSGRAYEEDERISMKVIQERGNTLSAISETQRLLWQEQTASVTEKWQEKMQKRGKNPQEMLNRARELMEKYTYLADQ